MDSYSDYMAAGYGVNALASIGGAYAQAQALRAQGDYQKEMTLINTRFATIKAEDAIKLGETAAGRARKKARATVGAQRVAMASQGIDVNSGTAAQIQEDTHEAGLKEAMTIRNNAWREAWGYKTQAALDMGKSSFLQQAAENEANSTLVTGGLKALDYGLRAGAGMSSPKGKDEKVQRDPDLIEGYSGVWRRSMLNRTA